jgi:hypothetical protein
MTTAHMIRTALAMADSNSVCLETILPAGGCIGKSQRSSGHRHPTQHVRHLLLRNP